jgi:uncharacterized protein YndB with AHSA1/START domain
VRRDGERFTLVMTREIGHPPHAVWRALTDPAALREWAPYDADRDLGAPGAATLTMAGGEGEPERLPATVRHAEPPRLLEYTWGEDVLRFELEAIPSGTRLTLSHTMGDPGYLSKVCAGWHICLDVFEALLAGRPIGRIVAGDAMSHGWSRLNDAYAERLEVAPGK